MISLQIRELDAVFMSYDEVYADFFFEKWQQIFKKIHRVHGVHGLNNAHIMACEAATTDYFVLIDADAYPLVDRFVDSTFSVGLDTVVANLQSIQSVTGTYTPHGGIKIINRKLAKAFFEGARSSTVNYVFKQGFEVIDGPALSVEFTNQSPELAFTSAYKDSALLLRATFDPITYIEPQDLSGLRGKRQRIWPWLTNGCEEPYGLYSVLGAHTAVYNVFTKNVPLCRESLEHYKRQKFQIPTLNSYSDLMDRLDVMYDELQIPMMVPIEPTVLRTDMYERFETLAKKYGEIL